jgi:hypothetical protein
MNGGVSMLESYIKSKILELVKIFKKELEIFKNSFDFYGIDNDEITFHYNHNMKIKITTRKGKRNNNNYIRFRIIHESFGGVKLELEVPIKNGKYTFGKFIIYDEGKVFYTTTIDVYNTMELEDFDLELIF